MKRFTEMLLNLITRSEKSPSLVGAHLSIAGGVHNAFDAAYLLECNTFQVFVKQPLKLFDSKIPDFEIKLWHERWQECADVEKIVAHAGYLSNLAHPDDEKWMTFISALRAEIETCTLLKIDSLVVHPGIPHEMGRKWGLHRIAKALDILCKTCDSPVKIALETTAGSGNQLGNSLEDFYRILNACKMPEKVGVCVDTAHIFAAGYDISEKDGYQTFWQKFYNLLGNSNLLVVHVNDSKTDCDSKIDRHAHIGDGKIGIGAFELLMRDPRLVRVPKILETPKEPGANERNLSVLRSFLR